MINKTNNITFTSRCPEIKLGQWVCHKINTNLPHYSSTKYTPLFNNFWLKNKGQNEKIKKIYNFYRTFVDKLYDVRATYQNGVISTLDQSLATIYQLKKSHFGNCGENAIVAKTILKMNGIDNCEIVKLKVGEVPIDHNVCIFNRDGSPFTKVINNKTILIDTWAGIVDFANNAFNEYKCNYQKYFSKNFDGKIDIIRKEQSQLTDKNIKFLSVLFPEFKKGPI